MARMHTRKRGKSKSRKPAIESVTEQNVDAKQAEELILQYQKQGMRQELIGQTLKDKHGIKYLKPVLGKRLGAFMQERGAAEEMPSDLLNLMKKAVNMRKHISKNHGDVHNKLRLNRVEAKIWRLGKYYRSEGKLPRDWSYDPEKAALIIKKL